MKACKRCNEQKILDKFHKDPRNKDGYCSWCIECMAWSARRWYQKNKELRKSISKEYHRLNRDKCLESQRRYIERNKELTLGRQLTKYWPGSTAMDAYYKFNDLMKAQNNLCAICKEPEKYIDHRSSKPKRLNVDHDHSTGVVRGLLCNRCNKAIGLLNDSLQVLSNAHNYLQKAAS